MSNAGDSSSFQVEPSTPHSINNVQDAIIGDDQSVPQVGSYQPTPEGSKFWVPDATNKPIEGTVFDTLELALKFYKDYAREAGSEVRRGGQKKTKNADPTLKYFVCAKQGFKPTSNNVNKKYKVVHNLS
ncbi:FAR1 DNA binding domain, zinc finger, SWIM-type, MULE transposase domain containing protein [Tanacetum coccineum]